MHYQIKSFNKFVKGQVADRVQDSCNKGLKFVNVQFVYQVNSMSIPVTVQSLERGALRRTEHIQ